MSKGEQISSKLVDAEPVASEPFGWWVETEGSKPDDIARQFVRDPRFIDTLRSHGLRVTATPLYTQPRAVLLPDEIINRAIFTAIVSRMESDNGCEFTIERGDFARANKAIAELRAAGFFADDPDDIDGDYWYAAGASDETEAAERFSRAAEAYAPLNEVLQDIFDRPLPDAAAKPCAVPDVRFTYKDQPNNIEAWRLGEACCKASKDPAGDYIDSGLVLLRRLQEKGYGVFRLAAAPQPEAPEVADAAHDAAMAEQRETNRRPAEPDDEKILRGVVANAGRLSGEQRQRWAHVLDATALGSNSSIALCRRFGFDPDEVVGGEKCEGGSPECGPVEHWDIEGVPLCAKCWRELQDEQRGEGR